MPNALLAIGDSALSATTALALKRQGLDVRVAADGAEALRRWAAERPHIVVVDAELPRVSGIEVCRRICLASRDPVIVLGDTRDDQNVVAAFRAGADDYVVRPFSPRILALRINAVLRRCLAAPPTQPPVVRAGVYTVHDEVQQVEKGSLLVQLTPLEFRIFRLLAGNEGRVVSFSRLIEYVWGHDGGDARLLKTHINHVRRKLGMVETEPGYIKVVLGLGYVLTRS